MRRDRPPRLLGAWVLLGIWLAAGQGALAVSIRSPGDAKPTFPIRSADGSGPEARLKTAELPFLQGQLCPLEQRLFADAADGQLDEFSLLTAALVAGGVDDEETLDGCRRRQAAMIEQLRHDGGLAGPPRTQAQVVFEFMHAQVLHGGYRPEGTELRGVLETGQFNCVSASVLFNSLAGELGLEVCGLETPGHAMSRLKLPDGPFDVETTCPRWFQLVAEPPSQAKPVSGIACRDLGVGQAENVPLDAATVPIRTEARTAVPGAAVASRPPVREVSPVQMVAMIYYNRGVDLLGTGQFDRAATANAKALWLDPQSATARGNLLATINNWAIALGDADRHGEAIDLLRLGMRLDPAFPTFEPNYVHIHYRWVDRLCQAGQYEEALAILGRAAAEMPGRTYFRQAATEVYRCWAKTLLVDTQPDPALAALVRPVGRRVASGVSGDLLNSRPRNAGH